MTSKLEVAQSMLNVWISRLQRLETIQNSKLFRMEVLQKRQLLIPSAHGGISSPEGTEIVIGWFKFHDWKKWVAAKSFCENQGGKLFTKVNGSKEQLDFCTHFRTSTFGWEFIEKPTASLGKQLTDLW